MAVEELEDEEKDDADLFGDKLNTESPPSSQEENLVQDVDSLEPKETSTDKEVTAADNYHKELTKKSTDLQKSLPPYGERAHPYQQMLQQYRDLQDQNRKNNMLLGILAGGQIAGQGLTGRASGNFKTDLSNIDMLRQMSAQPVKDFEEAQKYEKNAAGLQVQEQSIDPSSDMSKAGRRFWKEKFKEELPETTSMSDIEKLLKSIGRPATSKYQKVTGTVKDPVTGKEIRMSAWADPQTHTYIDDSGKPLVGFIQEGINPFQVTKGEHGQNQIFNKSRGGAPVTLTSSNNFISSKTPSDIYSQFQPEDRKYLNDKIVPAFNKLNEKTIQRLGHVDPILQRLQEATTNPAALNQAKAEIARFDVGDQRLAQQEFNMFLQRHGMPGWQDWLAERTTGTIPQDLADAMTSTIKKTAATLQNEVNQKAEEQAKLVISRMPKNQQIDPKLVAPLIYGKYTPSQAPQEEKVWVTSSNTNKRLLLPKDKVEDALKKKLIKPLGP